MQIRQLSLILLSIFLISSSILYMFVNKIELLSYVIAFITSTIVVLASFKNYKNMVDKRLQSLEDANEVDNQDLIDKIGNPYGVFDDEDDSSNLKELKKSIKPNIDKKEVAKNSLIAFMPIRLVAYVILIAGFFLLLNNNYLDLYFYIPTLIIPNIISVIYLIFFTEN